MRSSFGLSPLATALLLTGACQHAAMGSTAEPAGAAAANARPAHWSYEGKLGPESWSALSPAYAACGQGRTQSPIDLPESLGETTSTLRLNYKSTSLRIAHHEHVTDILDNGHTIQVTVDEGSTLVTGRGTYQLKQFHFHTPSEHTVAGKLLPMEVHFVHQSDDGRFAVVGVLFAEGAANENLATLIPHLPPKAGEGQARPDVQLDLRFDLPTHSAAYHYMGSFTTPPCTEDVEWLIPRTPRQASAAQLAAFAERLDHNNRPIQAMNDRPLDQVTVEGAFSSP